jgi:hypothetical protein
MKTLEAFGVRCAAIFIVMAMIITIVPMNALIQTASASGSNGPAPVDLGTAGNYVILGETKVTTTGTTKITGDIGISPKAASFMTGFSESAPPTTYTSALVTGKLYAADYDEPTPTALGVAIGDMGTAYTNASGRTLPDATELGTGDITGMTLAPGLYKWSTGVNIYGAGVTLSGGSNAVWIFQIAGDLTVASTAMVNLTGGAQASNIFWQVGGGAGATLGTTCVFNGNILSATAVIMNTGATLNGRALAQTAVTMDSNNVSLPSNPLVSSVDPISHYWKNTSPLTITANASASSNYVKLFYRFSSDNTTWATYNEFGNDTASPWSWSFTFTNGSGFYQFYTVAYVDLVTFEATPSVADQICGYDNVEATSSVDAMGTYWKNASPQTITATATDAISGVMNVSLYYRFAANNATWGAWTLFGVDLAAPWSWSFNFPSGSGYYQVYSRANDTAANFEAAPGVADRFCGYDFTAPTSSVNALVMYWENATPLTVLGTSADALSGVKDVTLYYKYTANNGTGGTWTSFGMDSASPWSWSFNFPSGNGYYQFFSRANDNAANFEAAPGVADQTCGYDTVIPTSSVNAIASYWNTASPLTITGIAADATSGVKNVTLYFRYSVNNATWGAWTSFDIDLTTPWSWIFTFPSGSGYYQFYSMAYDNATNFEAEPLVADAISGYDINAPTSSLNAIGTYWQTAGPLTITATAADAFSGVKSVSLYYRYSADDASWGTWTSFGVDLTAPWSWSFNFPGGNGYYQFYSRASDKLTNIEAVPGIIDQTCGYDNVVPTSNVDAMGAYWQTTSPQTVTGTSSDATSGVQSVSLFYRFSADNVSWGVWGMFGNDETAPWSWSFTFPNGNGYYQFYSIANDVATNFEAAPGVADQIYAFDMNAPTSSLDAMGTYWKISSPMMVTGTSADTTSGVQSVSLYYRFASNNATWGGWTSFGVDLAAPWSWSFNFPNGTGYYQLFSRASDTAGNFEATKGVSDQNCGYDISTPTSIATAMGPYWKNTSPLTVTALAANSISGVKDVTLYFKYSTDNSTWGAWTLFGVDHATPWSWSFDFPSGSGYYQFYTLAIDTAGNAQVAPSVADVKFAYDTEKPIIGTDTTPIAIRTGETLTFNSVITDNIGVTSAKVVYRFGSGAWVNQTMVSSGTYHYALAIPSTSTLSVQYYIYAADATGNWRISPTKTVVVLDTTIPTVIILGPANGLVTKNILTTVHGTADDVMGTVAMIEWTLDSTSWNTCTGTSVWSCDVSITTGSNQVIIRATDSSGNQGTTDVMVSLDMTSPTLTINGLVDNSVVKNSKQTITGTATDNIVITKVEVRVNDGNWETATGTNTWTYDATLKNGKNTIDIRTTDSAGNVATQTRTIQKKQAASPVVYPPYTIAIVEVLVACAIGAVLLMSRPPNLSHKKTDAQAKDKKTGEK